MSSESKKRKIIPCNKKGVAKFSSSQRRKEERNWKKEIYF